MKQRTIIGLASVISFGVALNIYTDIRGYRGGLFDYGELLFPIDLSSKALGNISSSYILYNLPDGLWLLSLFLFLIVIWGDKPIVSTWISLGLLMAISLEGFQYYGYNQGTFDLLDILTYMMMFALAVLIHKISKLKKMENWKTHFISFLAIGLFLATGLACDDTLPADASCDDPALILIKPTAEVSTSSSFDLLLLDDVTGQPIANERITYFSSIHQCIEYGGCPNACSWVITSNQGGGLTNSSGVYSSPTLTWTSEDENDVLQFHVVAVKWFGNEGQEYVAKDIIIRFKPNENIKKSETLRLLKTNSL